MNYRTFIPDEIANNIGCEACAYGCQCEGGWLCDLGLKTFVNNTCHEFADEINTFE